MKRSLLLLLFLAACQNVPPPGGAPDTPAPDGPGVPACLQNDQHLYEQAQEIELGRPVRAKTGERWFALQFDGPTKARITVENIPDYGHFAYLVYPPNDAPGAYTLAGESYLDTRDGILRTVSEDFEVFSRGLVLINITHTNLENQTCDEYKLTVSGR